MSYFDKHFTLEEARALVPEIKKAFRRIEDIRNRLGIKADQLEPELRHSSGNGGGRKSAEYLQALLELNNIVTAITDKGILVKDLSIGLVDFPHLLDGREVLLCYRVDEETIDYWHDLDTGFAGRTPIS